MASNPPPGDRGFLGWINRRLWLPSQDLTLSGQPNLPIPVSGDAGLVLAFVYGDGPNQPRLLQLDDSGHVILSSVSGSVGGVFVNDDPAVSGTRARVFATSDGIAAAPSLGVNNFPMLFNGSLWVVARSASATNAAAQSGLGVAMVAPPGEWNAQNNPASGAQASAVQAAGAAGVRHIGRRVSFGFSSQAALGGVSTVTFNLRDGASGAGTIKEAWTFDLPAAIIVPFAISFEVDVVGTAATAMTLEMSAAVAGLRGFVNLSGFDAS